jgi:hypothetical protein
MTRGSRASTVTHDVDASSRSTRFKQKANRACQRFVWYRTDHSSEMGQIFSRDLLRGGIPQVQSQMPDPRESLVANEGFDGRRQISTNPCKRCRFDPARC